MIGWPTLPSDPGPPNTHLTINSSFSYLQTEHPGLRGTPLAMMAALCNKTASMSPPPLADAAVGKGFHPWKNKASPEAAGSGSRAPSGAPTSSASSYPSPPHQPTSPSPSYGIIYKLSLFMFVYCPFEWFNESVKPVINEILNLSPFLSQSLINTCQAKSITNSNIAIAMNCQAVACKLLICECC